MHEARSRGAEHDREKHVPRPRGWTPVLPKNRAKTTESLGA
jgi:hypothetical protein